MNKTMRKLSFVGVALMLLLITACKNKNPSVLKVFVRSSSNELMQNAKVIIIADSDSDPPTPAHVDTVMTNSSGFALFKMDEFFDDLDKKTTTGYFKILAKLDPKVGHGYIQCRAHITSVETVYLEP